MEKKRFKTILFSLITVLLLIVLGSCAFRNAGLFKRDNTITVVDRQSNELDSLEYSDVAALTSYFESAQNAQGDVTYTLEEAKDSEGNPVDYFSLPSAYDTRVQADPKTPAGTYSLLIRADASGAEGYEAGSRTFHYSFVIGKSEGKLEKEPTALNDLVYTGKEQKLLKPGVSKTGTVLYRLGEDGEWSSEIPTATEAGIYTVYYKVEGDQNHKDIKEKSLIVSIGRKTVSSRSSYSGLTLGKTSSRSILDYVSGGGSSPIVVIKRKPVPSKPASKVEFTYDGAVHTNGYQNPEGITMVGQDSGTDAGVYTAIYTPLPNYCWPDGSYNPITVQMVIHKKAVASKPFDPEVVVYDDQIHTNGYVMPEHVNMLPLSVDSAIIAGTYKAYYVPENNYCWPDSDYDSSVRTVTMVIAKAQPSMEIVEAEGLVYNRKSQKLIKETSTDGGVLQFRLEDDLMYTTTIPSAKNAGDYKVYYRLIGDINHEDIPESYLVVSIAKDEVSTPLILKTEFTYNGYYMAPDVVPNLIRSSVSGDLLKRDVGNYEMIVSLRDPVNYCWKDGDSESIVIPWSITRKSLGDKPEETEVTAVYNGRRQSNGIRLDNVIVEGDTYGVDVGEYTAVYTPTDNYCWSDGTADPVSVTLTITKAGIKIPVLQAEKYVYDGRPQHPIFDTASAYSKLITMTGDTEATDAGEYTVFWTINDPDNYCWNDGRGGDKEYGWEILRRSVGDKPEQDVYVYYNGEEQSNGIDIEHVEFFGTNTGIDVGEYPANYWPANNYCWSDGTTDKVLVTLHIEKAYPTVISEPEALVLSYTGEDQPLVNAGEAENGTFMYALSADGTEPEDDEYSADIPEGKDPGIYTIYYMIKGDGDNYADEYYVTPLVSQIMNQLVAIPGTTGDYVYNGKAQTVELTGFYDECMEIVDGATYTDAGEYCVEIALTQPGLSWDDGSEYGSDENQLVRWVINKAEIEKPVITTAEFVYNGRNHRPEFDFDSKYSRLVTLSGDTRKSQVGEYTAVYSIKNPTNYCWSDGTDEALEFNWSIVRKSIGDKPEEQVTKTYNGYYQSNGYMDLRNVTATGKEYGRNVGDYVATYTPKDNYCWSDGTTDTVTVTLTIEPAAVKVDRKPRAIDGLVYNGKDQTLVTAGKCKDGTLYYAVLLNSDDPESGEYSTELPKELNAGFYAVGWYAKSNSDDYADSEKEVIIVGIGQKQPTIDRYPTGRTLTYTGGDLELVNNVELENGHFEFNVDRSFGYSELVPTAVEPGEYIIYYIFVPNDINYETVIFDEPLVTVINDNDPQVVTEPEAIEGLVYDGSYQDLIVGGVAEHGTYVYSLDGEDYSEDIPQGLEARTYVVFYKLLNNSNDADEGGSLFVNIDKADFTYSVPENIFQYNGEEQGEAIEACGVDDTPVTILYRTGKNRFSTEVPKLTDVSKTTVFFRIEAENHNQVEGSYRLEVTKADIVFTEEPQATVSVYDGDSHVLMTRGQTNDGTIMYSGNGILYNNRILPKETDDGEYSVYYYVNGDKNHNNYGPVELTAVIEPAVITVDEDLDQSFVYDGRLHGDKVTATTVNRQKYTVGYSSDPEQSSYSPNRPMIKNVDESRTIYYQITAPHHETLYGSYELAIEPAAGVISSDARPHYLLTYSGDYQQLLRSGAKSSTGTVMYCLEDGTLTDDYRDIVGLNAGEYTVTYFSEGDSNHYDSEAHELKVTIYRAAGWIEEVPVTYYNLIYDAEEKQLIDYGGSSSTGEMLFSLDPDSGFTNDPYDIKATDAGDYNVYYYSKGDANHYDTKLYSFDVSIEKGQAVILTEPEAREDVVYDGYQHDLIIPGVSNFDFEDETIIVYEGRYATEAGDYEVKYYIPDSDNYYGVEEQTIYASISKADTALSVVAEPDDIVLEEGSAYLEVDLLDYVKSYAGDISFELNGAEEDGFVISGNTLIIPSYLEYGNYYVEIIASDTGDDNYEAGSAVIDFTVVIQAPLTDETTTILGIDDVYYYAGDLNKIVPQNIEVYYKGERLYEGYEYSVALEIQYIVGDPAGTGTVTITGIGIYKDSLTVTYSIIPEARTLTLGRVNGTTLDSYYGEIITLPSTGSRVLNAWYDMSTFHVYQEGEDYTVTRSTTLAKVYYRRTRGEEILLTEDDAEVIEMLEKEQEEAARLAQQQDLTQIPLTELPATTEGEETVEPVTE